MNSKQVIHTYFEYSENDEWRKNSSSGGAFFIIG